MFGIRKRVRRVIGFSSTDLFLAISAPPHFASRQEAGGPNIVYCHNTDQAIFIVGDRQSHKIVACKISVDLGNWSVQIYWLLLGVQDRSEALMGRIAQKFLEVHDAQITSSRGFVGREGYEHLGS